MAFIQKQQTVETDSATTWATHAWVTKHETTEEEWELVAARDPLHSPSWLRTCLNPGNAHCKCIKGVQNVGRNHSLLKDVDISDVIVNMEPTPVGANLCTFY